MVKFALKYPYTIIVAVIMLLVLGAFSMLRLPLDILPTFRLPAVMVVTTYTGMPASEMEIDITSRLERWLSQAQGLDHLESRSMNGVSIINAFFAPGFDPNNALAQISTLVMSDLHYLPPGTQPPIVIAYDPTASLPAGLLTTFTPNFTEAQLWDESNYIVRNQLNSLRGTVAPVVFGGTQRQVMVYLDPNKLSGYGISPLEVVNALGKDNSMIPTGDAKIGKFDLSISSNAMVPSIADFDKIPIKVINNAPVFIGDIGQTKDAAAIQTNVVQVNGRRSTYIPLFRQLGASTLTVVENIRAALPRITGMMPARTELRVIFDQSPKVKEAISEVVRELVIGVLLASLVIYLFLGSFTPTLIASAIIPLSIIGGMVALYYAGQTLNIMTLGGLALITGPLIDKAVVALENIERHLEMGKSPAEAADVGASEVQMPILMASLALILVFYPVTFFEGLGKFLFIPMAVSVAVTEIISYFAVMGLVPLMATWILKPKDHHAPPKKLAVWFNSKFARLQNSYRQLLTYALRVPEVVVILSVTALVASCFLVPFLGTEFFPVNDHGQFYIRVRAPSGTRIELTTKLVTDVATRINELLPKKSVEVVLANTGVINNWAAAYSPNSGSHESLLEVGLHEDSAISGRDAIKKLRADFKTAFPNVHFSFSMIDPVASALNYGALNDLDLRITSPKLAKGAEIADAILAKTKLIRGVRDASIEQALDYPAIHIDVDRTKSAYLGLSADDVIKNVITALNSSILFAPNFWDDPVSGNNYFIGASYPEKAIDVPDVINNIPIQATSVASKSAAMTGMVGGNGDARPITLLRNLATLSSQKLPVTISHSQIQRVFDVVANIEGRDIGSVAAEMDDMVKSLHLPANYPVQWVGQINAMRSSFASMGTGMILSLILVFLLMVAQLKSFVDPLLIMATVPMGFIGVFWMLFLTGTSLNIQSMMGMIMLIGIVVSNTVILTDFANQRLNEGASIYQAIYDAGVTRLRPILMTAISAIAALLPSSISGANAPLARAVIGGLLTSTFLSLVFLPSLYVLVKTGKLRRMTTSKLEPVFRAVWKHLSHRSGAH